MKKKTGVVVREAKGGGFFRGVWGNIGNRLYQSESGFDYHNSFAKLVSALILTYLYLEMVAQR